jgi:phage repressor protein C with HTH and peptisase S24 domain
MTQTTFHERLNAAMGAESAHAFAKRAGLSDSSFRQYLKGSMPGLDNLIDIAHAAGVSLDWLALGRGEMKPTNGHAQSNLVPAADAPPGFISVPMLDIRPSAGAGAIASHEDGEVDIVAFREEWLRRLGVSPKFARLMVAQGDSMRETVNDGDLMIVDISIREFIDEAIYVLVYGGLVRLKRLQMLRSGILLLKSDNPRYETEEVPMAEQPELIIGGRVRWVGGAV